MDRIFKIFTSPEELAEVFARDLVNQIIKAEKKQKPFTISLSGGSTPEILYSILADKYTKSADWKQIHFFWGDERCVPPDSSESNYGMAYRIFLSKIEIPEKNIHRIRGEENSEKEAARYSGEIMRYTSRRSELPKFDVIILGIGDDGHTASIFPGSLYILKSERICEAVVHPVSGQERVTITGKVINNADSVFFLVTGENKSNIIRQIFKKEAVSEDFPAAYIVPVHGRSEWWLDEKAGTFIR